MCLTIFKKMTCTAEAIEDLLRKSLSPERLEHSRRVADLARDLCARYGLDGAKGTLAGLAHDLAREMDLRKVQVRATRDGGGISALEAERPVLLHGRAASVLLRDALGVADPEILDAVASHVTGRPSMGLLAKIVFIADFLEPGRGFLDEKFRLRALELPLDSMMILVLEEIFKFLKTRAIAGPARDLYEELLRKC
jgi:predicted HD superfamily hydrolase involved in NAD metabolism